MKDGYFATAHPLSKLVLIVFLMVVIYLIFFGFSILVGKVAFGTGLSTFISLAEQGNYSEHLPFMKFMQMMYSTGLFLVPALMAAWLIGGSVSHTLCIRRSTSWQSAGLVVLIMLASIPLINLLAYLNDSVVFPEWLSGFEQTVRGLEDQAGEMMEAFLAVSTMKSLFANLLMIAVLPALGEEFLFRGIVQRIFSNWTRSHHAGIWIGAVLFSLMHFQFFGLIPRIFLGAAFGYMLVWSGSIWLPVLGHFINNAGAVVFYHFYYKDQFRLDLDSIGTVEDGLVWSLFSAALVFMLLVGLYKNERMNRLDV